MTRAVLSIGSNLGDRVANLRSVLEWLGPRVVLVSPVYETAPWGPVPQADYLNAVVVADDPDRDAHGWLEVVRALERAAGRERLLRWGPRTLDVDVIAVTDRGAPVSSPDPELTLPHPRAHQRAFVLVPWEAAEPDAELVVAEAGLAPRAMRVAELIGALPEEERRGVRRAAVGLGAGGATGGPAKPDGLSGGLSDGLSDGAAEPDGAATS